MALTPRLMVVEHVATFVPEQTQRIGLYLLDRAASAEFYEKFPATSCDDIADTLDEEPAAGSGEDTSSGLLPLMQGAGITSGQSENVRKISRVEEIISYARMHGIEHIGERGSGFPHRRHHDIAGTRYHSGDVVTEKEAYDFGYVEPHINTVAGLIVQAYYYSHSQDHLVEILRGHVDILLGQRLISEEQTAVFNTTDFGYGQIDVVSNERLWEFKHGTVREMNCASHPITLFVFPPGKDGVWPVGVSFYVPEKNTVYEFMTHVRVDR